MTQTEHKLWLRLRSGQLAGTKLRRQVPIGGFIADFCSHKPKVVIEVDGGQHAEAASRDVARTRVLELHGYTVLRFWNHEVLSNIEGVLATIVQAVAARTSAPSPSPTLRTCVGKDTGQPLGRQ